jgi:hypothetical protein
MHRDGVAGSVGDDEPKAALLHSTNASASACREQTREFDEQRVRRRQPLRRPCNANDGQQSDPGQRRGGEAGESHRQIDREITLAWDEFCNTGEADLFPLFLAVAEVVADATSAPRRAAELLPVVRPEGVDKAREAAGGVPYGCWPRNLMSIRRGSQRRLGRPSAIIAGATVTASTVSVISRRQAATGILPLGYHMGNSPHVEAANTRPAQSRARPMPPAMACPSTGSGGREVLLQGVQRRDEGGAEPQRPPGPRGAGGGR